jgi:hypothetical protein
MQHFSKKRVDISKEYNKRRIKMSEEMTAVFIVGIIFGSIIAVIKILSDNRIKNRLIDSAAAGEKMANLNITADHFNNPINAIKWGLVLLGVGSAFMLGQLFPWRMSDSTTFGLMLIFGGAAFLIYYFIAKNIQQHHQQEPHTM